MLLSILYEEMGLVDQARSFEANATLSSNPEDHDVNVEKVEEEMG